MQRLIFSGIQPTGRLHLGNYLGAVRNWVQLQAAARTPPASAVCSVPQRPPTLVYSIVDLHAMTQPYSAAGLQGAVREMTAALLACGLDPGTGSPGSSGARVVLYAQSAVREHAELGWLLSCLTPLGWLQRMTQFKQKGGKERGLAPLGLLSYPVLQAADILLYRATHVPVGEDQVQHLELARDIAVSFNHAFCADAHEEGREQQQGAAGGSAPVGAGSSASGVASTSSKASDDAGAGLGIASKLRPGRVAGAMAPFPLPQAMLLPTAARVMSLRDGSRKMSKSDRDDGSRINLDDGPDALSAKVRVAKTDSSHGFAPLDAAARPEKANLCAILGALTQRTPEEVAAAYADASAAAFKADLTEALVVSLGPIQSELVRLRADPAHLDRVLQDGAGVAGELASATMKSVRLAMGYT